MGRSTVASIIVSSVITALCPVTALSRPELKGFPDFLRSVPNTPAQSAFLIKRPLSLKAAKKLSGSNPLERVFLEFFTQLALAGSEELLDKANAQHITGTELWTWTDLTRRAAEYKNKLPEDSACPTITVLSVNEIDATHRLEAVARKTGKIAGTVDGKPFYEFRVGKDTDAAYIAFTNNKVLASNERALMESLLTSAGVRREEQKLLQSNAWKQVDQDASIWEWQSIHPATKGRTSCS